MESDLDTLQSAMGGILFDISNNKTYWTLADQFIDWFQTNINNYINYNKIKLYFYNNRNNTRNKLILQK